MLKRLTLALALLAAGAGAATLLGIGAAGAAQAPTVQNVQNERRCPGKHQGPRTGNAECQDRCDREHGEGRREWRAAADRRDRQPGLPPGRGRAQFETPAGDIASAATVYTVPSGSELVIEQVSVTSDQTLAEVRLSVPGTEPGGEGGSFLLAPQATAYGSVGDMLTRIYAAPAARWAARSIAPTPPASALRDAPSPATSSRSSRRPTENKQGSAANRAPLLHEADRPYGVSRAGGPRTNE